MVFTHSFAITLVLLGFHSFSVVLGGQVQKSGLTLPPNARRHRDTVGNIFTNSYLAYKQYAFGHDDLSPKSRGFNDNYNGWGATIVDAMDTMVIMGLTDYLKDAVEFVRGIDYSKSKTSSTVSVFETTIRHLGGLLSTHELTGEKYPILLQKATELGDKLSHAWVVVNDVPYGHLDFGTNLPSILPTNVAEAGTLTLEFSRLSKYTGNDTYRQLAEKSVRHIASLPAPLPGLPGQGIDPTTGQTDNTYVTWGGGTDSYFEYLIKYARLTNTQDNIFADAWFTSVDSSIKTLLKTSTVGNWKYLADYDTEQRIVPVGSHLACFYGGNWILGGRLLNNETIVDHGLALTDACWNTYESTATGIGPEAFAYTTTDGDQGSPSTEQTDFYNKHGFYITAPDYVLRPEVLESNFYAWRVTGDTKYWNRTIKAMESFEKYLTSTVAYAGIYDVDSVTSAQIDDMQSFWFAEVLKYLYLTFDDPANISLDNYVFNTECHPFKAPDALPSYGSGNLLPPKPFTPSPSNAPLPAVSPNPFLPPNIVLGL